jgi:hypothetical protein
MRLMQMGVPMTQHFTVFGGSFVHETHSATQAHGFSAPRRRPALAVWGFVLGSLLVAASTVATVTVSAAQAALH